MEIKSVSKIPTSARVHIAHTEGIADACLVALAHVAANVPVQPYGWTIRRADNLSEAETYQTASVTLWTD